MKLDVSSTMSETAHDDNNSVHDASDSNDNTDDSGTGLSEQMCVMSTCSNKVRKLKGTNETYATCPKHGNLTHTQIRQASTKGSSTAVNSRNTNTKSEYSSYSADSKSTKNLKKDK